MTQRKDEKPSKPKRQVKKVANQATKFVLNLMYEWSQDALHGMIDPYGAVRGEAPPWAGIFTRRQIGRAISGLKRQGLLKSREQSGHTLYALTEEGKHRIDKIRALESVAHKKPDGKWRIVVYDIPDDEKQLRDTFRNLLKEFGFKLFQASVWIHDLDVFTELEQLVPDIKQHNWIKLLLVEAVVGDQDFREMFKVK